MTEFDCARCANPAHATDTGVTHHDDPDSPTGIDHDLDADHTPYPHPEDDERTHLGMTADDLLAHLRDPASGHAFTPADERDLWTNMSASSDYLDLLAAYHDSEHQQGADLPHSHSYVDDPEDDEPYEGCTHCGRAVSDLGLDSDGSRRCDDTDPAHRFHAILGRPLMATHKHLN